MMISRSSHVAISPTGKKGEKDGGDKQNGEGATDEKGMAAYDDDEMW